MKKIQNKKQTIWYDDSILSGSPEQCCDPEFWQQQNKIIGSAQGRGTTWFVALDKMDAALRHYRRGGLFGKLIKDHYIFTGWEKTRSYQEFQLLNTLIKAGVNVPKPIAARATKRTFCYQADLLSQKIPNARDLVAILQEKPLSKEMYQKIGNEIRKMHAAQVNHTDLNIHNILIDDNDKVWIIDFDKCYQQKGDDWKQGNWDRLKRSFVKEVSKKNIYWANKEWAHLFGH
ncbi:MULTISPECIES: 3-deoxy-D-manno-octulosonic acid kinase [Aliivibrio]|uniref:3-deoxy-D-manno-octulosonic acid kinase n=1 Tax=Aliivibrio finisterrensis TaxID=511998 RepID=A0A4Q5KPI9_9GAMM|nr:MULTISPECIES: 3-deoxy-D-manno-octulosonic acid kinase [Aliivibrio]MDD9180612.1 3-deoxy-D-manno-octulosonic acid kinase [Aliivibrio sp. A6]RYU47772.1 3-deoxy-D-manno-octulosonic acid kinase [Aliivibrio finisterrensis]RYU48804.1 3-deoxy-D-manno-octulosonic acid kinase [Aliivibrio finisterrensis]RYU53544.1 3-deoxy-D-manno-octulosonic acid kinase [Aliivibrio finisterrensis]RYU61805.1 3-deoxy-D-manno-octulosonic acid kinase [Aliivibrio finisterrensis]